MRSSPCFRPISSPDRLEGPVGFCRWKWADRWQSAAAQLSPLGRPWSRCEERQPVLLGFQEVAPNPTMPKRRCSPETLPKREAKRRDCTPSEQSSIVDPSSRPAPDACREVYKEYLR